MQRHSEEKRQNKCMSRCEVSLEYKQMYTNVRDKGDRVYKELDRDVKDMQEKTRFDGMG